MQPGGGGRRAPSPRPRWFAPLPGASPSARSSAARVSPRSGIPVWVVEVGLFVLLFRPPAPSPLLPGSGGCSVVARGVWSGRRGFTRSRFPSTLRGGSGRRSGSRRGVGKFGPAWPGASLDPGDFGGCWRGMD